MSDAQAKSKSAGFRAYYDLHIHSGLSPCGDEQMTPNNIVNMALLKGLDIIAVTDHNTAENLSAIASVAAEAGLAFIPGIEVESSEEFHSVCLFPSVSAALAMQDIIYAHLPKIENKPDIFGRQYIFDTEDEVIGECRRMLLTATSLSAYELYAHVISLGGVAIPAHIDRSSYSILISLGFIPDDLPVNFVELSKRVDPNIYLTQKAGLDNRPFIQSSDAHYLHDISERINHLEIECHSPESVIGFLKKD